MKNGQSCEKKINDDKYVDTEGVYYPQVPSFAKHQQRDRY
jgi:hypothetical protein